MVPRSGEEHVFVGCISFFLCVRACVCRGEGRTWGLGLVTETLLDR